MPSAQLTPERTRSRRAAPRFCPRVGGHGGAEAFQRDAEQVAGLAGGGNGCHGGAAQHIDRPLHDDGADGSDAALQSHGQAHGQQADADPAVQAGFFRLHTDDIKFFDQVDQTGDAGDGLGQIGGERGAKHAGPEEDDEEQVQAHIQRTGDDQENQRVRLSPRARMMHATILYKNTKGMPAKIQPI